MMSLLRLIPLIATTLAYTYSDQNKYPDSNAWKTELSQTQVNWLGKILGGSRGLIYGLHEGFFRNKKKINKLCLNDSVKDEFASFVHFAFWGELKDIVYVADDFGDLWRNNFYFCGVQEMGY